MAPEAAPLPWHGLRNSIVAFNMKTSAIAYVVAATAQFSATAIGPFLEQRNNNTWIIGNNL